MSDAIYQKPTLFAEGENRIDLSASEQLALRDALGEQIIKHKISGLSQELIYAIFHKTIRHNKREDDLNGICLSNLTSTGSRSDYVNKHVTKLIRQSVLISRLGHYGRIISINFNAEQWGKTPEYNRENSGLKSDPEALLATLDIPAEIEIPEASSASSSHTLHEHSASNAAELHDQIERLTHELERSSTGLNSHATHGNERLSINNLSALISDNIPANLAMLITEDMIKQGLHKLIEIVSNLLKDIPILEFIGELLQPQTETKEQEPQPATELNVPDNAQHNPPTEIQVSQSQPQASIVISEQEPQIKPQAPITLSESQTPTAPSPANHSESHSENSTPNDTKENKIDEKPAQTNDHTQLIFPVELKPFEQKQIISLLAKEPQHDTNTVQTVLNSMSSRYKIDMEPIKSPIAYFRYLLKSSAQGSFDSSYAEIYEEQRKEHAQQSQTTSEKQQRREKIDKYNTAKNNYERLKLYLDNTDKSMRQLAKDLSWEKLLDEMGFDLDIDTKQAVPT